MLFVVTCYRLKYFWQIVLTFKPIPWKPIDLCNEIISLKLRQPTAETPSAQVQIPLL